MNKSIFILLIASLFPNLLFAQFSETKEISKQFGVSSETRIEITNKYGRVEINTWDKDSVVVEVEIEVEEKKLSKLKESMDEINIDFTESQNYLIIRTAVGENRSALQKEILKFKEAIFSSDGNVEINYQVWLPEANDLKVENKFGDVFIGDCSGDVEINLSNGNLKSNDFTGKTDLILNFVNATINEIKNGRLDCSYSDLYIKKAESLKIVSKSTTFEILEIRDMDANSRRDKFRVRLADYIDAEGSFSNFRINELTDRLSLKSDNGDIEVEKIAPDFSNILIESNSTDANLYFPTHTNFNFEITHAKTEVYFCDEMKVEEETEIDEKNNKVQVSGYYNEKDDDGNKLVIDANSGAINVMSN